MTRTWAIGRPSSWATVCCVARMPWVDSCSVSLPPSHTATVDGASIGL